MSSYRHDPSQSLYPAFNAYSQQPRPGTALHYQQQPAPDVSGALAPGIDTTENDSISGPATDHAFTGVVNDHHMWTPAGYTDVVGRDRAVTTTSNAAVMPFTSDPLLQAYSHTTQTNQNMTHGVYDYHSIAQNQYYGQSGNSGGQPPSYHENTSILPAPPHATEMSTSRMSHSSTYAMPQATSSGDDTSGQEVRRVHGVQSEQQGWLSINIRIPPVVSGSAQLEDGLFVEYYKEQDGTTVVHGRIPTDRNQSTFVRAHAHY